LFQEQEHLSTCVIAYLRHISISPPLSWIAHSITLLNDCPVSSVSTLDRYHQGRKCTRSSCNYSHSDTSFTQFLSVLESAAKTLDVCVFTITNDTIAQVRCEFV
jgi:hypothetical protein